MNVNRESGKAPTLNSFIRPIKILAVIVLIIVVAIATYRAVLTIIPIYEIRWNFTEFHDSTENGENSLFSYPFISRKGSWNKDEQVTEVILYWEDLLQNVLVKNKPFRLEGQYIVENDKAKLVSQGYYTIDGNRVEFYKEFPLKRKCFSESKYGPMQYIDKLIYIPDEIKRELLMEIAENRAEIEDLKKNGTTLRKHRFFYTALFSVISLAAIYCLLWYYKKYNPKFEMRVYSSSNDPSDDFYYVLPVPKIDDTIFRKIHVPPAEHINKQFNDVIKVCEEFKKICESHRGDIPAKFEGKYIPSAMGCVFELKGYYTENGFRRDIIERTALEVLLINEPFYPPEELRPDLSWQPGQRG